MGRSSHLRKSLMNLHLHYLQKMMNVSMLSPQEFKRLLLQAGDLGEIVDEHIIHGEAWVLKHHFPKRHHTEHEQFKRIVTNSLGLRTSECALVGSGKLGFSVAPTKKFRKFDSRHSDLDVAIVSGVFFERVWEELTVLYHRRKASVPVYERKCVFRKFVNLKVSELPEFAHEPLKQIYQEFGEIQSRVDTEFRFSYQLNFRIYRDWPALHNYHEDSLAALKGEL